MDKSKKTLLQILQEEGIHFIIKVRMSDIYNANLRKARADYI
jgi:hypothetical protein